MKMRRFLSVLLALAMVMSILSVGAVAASAAQTDTAEVAADVNIAAAGSAYSDMLSKTTVENNYGLSSTVNDGTILQAWTWSFANIEANLETIAEQGFTTIQVSPPNEIKKGTKGAKFLQNDGQNGWWMFYQPAGFQLNNSTDNALGTKAQFVSMCNKAHEMGLKIIVDAVINHMGTKEGDDSNTSSDPMSHVTPKAKTYEPEIYNNALFHNPWKQMQYIESDNTYYNSAYDLTRNCTSGLPDLKTEDQRVQNAIYDYMDELIAAGADGFRFDAAKHIETPDDHDGLGSDFWTDTLKKVQNKYSDREVYAYGEILNTCGISRPYSWYTKLFDVTDSKSYWCISNAVKEGGNVGEWNNATPQYPNSNFTAANTVLWDESHDTYVDKSTTSLSTTQRGKIWALVAGRAGISSVYLARPSDNTNTNDLYNITLGEARKTSWSNATTKAINQFHNYFIGQSEYCTSNSGGTAYIERGNSGAMIVNLGGTTAKNVNLTNHKLAAGEYKDAITGNKFTVTSSKISGSVGSTGVAVLYENNPVIEPTDPPVTEPPVTYVLGDVDDNGEVDATDATLIMRYTVDQASFSDKQTLAADVDGDKVVSIIDATLIQRYVAHMNVKYDIGQEKIYDPNVPVNPTTPPIVIPTNPPYEPPTEPDPVVKDSFLLTDNFGWGAAYVYAWDAEGNALVGEWPGASQAETQVNEYGETQFKCYIPDGAVGVILNNGNGAQTEDITDFSYDGYWMDGTQNELGHYLVTGWNYSGPVDPDPYNPDPYNPDPDPIATSGSFLLTDNFNWGSAYVYAWDASGNALNGEWPGASQAQTQTNEYGETQFVCYIPEGAAGVILNNGNGEQTEDITDFSYDGYWMDGSKNDLGHYKVIGWNSDGSGGTVDPEPYNPDPTPAPSGASFLLTDNFGWGSAYVYAWDANGTALNGEWPGASQAEAITNDFGETQFRCYVPEGATGVILNNGNGAQTEDITDFSYDGYWMDGSKNGLGHYIVTGWNYGDTPVIPSDDPDDPPYYPSGDGNTIIFSNNKGFQPVDIYYWSDSQSPVEWPGVAMTYLDTNEFGEQRYIFEMPDGMTNYIISDGYSQTVDIPFTGSTGVYMTSQDGEGHYMVDFYAIDGSSTPDPVDPNPQDPTEPYNPYVPSGNSFLLTDNFGWGSAYVYAWDAAGNAIGGEWPGTSQAQTQINEYGQTQFVCEVPEGAVGVILNNGNGAQTEDITDFSYDGFWMDGTQNELGHYIVTGWRNGDNPDPVNPDPVNPDPVPTASSFLLTDNFGWGAAYVYAWDANGNALNGEWPGASQAQTQINEYGETQFVCNVPEGAVGVILNNGSGAQTEDITDFSYDGFWMDGTQNALGHYIVTGWNTGDPGVQPSDPDPDPTPSGNDVIFEPGEANVADPAWFAWVWNDGSEGQWIAGTVSGSNIIFSGAGSFGNILVVRMPTDSTSASWDTCWNQSEDVAVQSGTLYFTGWGSGNKFNIGWK